jgi:dihydropteroate synthase
MQQAPRYGHVVEEVLAFLRERVQVAIAHGIKGSQIVLDPGFGFGKLQEHNLQLLAEFDAFTKLGYPVLAGVSRKQFIGNLTQQPVQERGYGTAGAVAVAVLKGARIIRVHDVAIDARYRIRRVSHFLSRAFSCRGIQCVNCSAQTVFAGWPTSNR